jgi:hypothetical protein
MPKNKLKLQWTSVDNSHATQNAEYKGKKLTIKFAGPDEYDGYINDVYAAGGTDDFEGLADTLIDIVDNGPKPPIIPFNRQPQVTVILKED